MLMTDGTIHMDRLVTYGNTPGYRDVHLVIEVNGGSEKREVTLYLTPEDADTVMHHIRHTLDISWNNGHPPLDVKDGERKPHWLADAERFEWLLRNVSAAEWERLGVKHDGGKNGRARIDAAMTTPNLEFRGAEPIGGASPETQG